MGFLRFVLSVSVVIAHSDSFLGFTLTGGLVAVETFFMISGFYMAMILDRKYIDKGSYRLFLGNRLLRLYPLYWTVLIVTIISSVVYYAFCQEWLRLSTYVDYIDTLSLKTVLPLIFTNIFVVGQDIVMFLGLDTADKTFYFTSNFRNTDPQLYKLLLIPQAWSLGIEIIFYIFVPFIVKRSSKFIAMLMCISIAIKILTYCFLGRVDDPWTYGFFLSEQALFFLGILSYRLYNILKARGIFNRTMMVFIVVLFFLTVLYYPLIPPGQSYLAQIKAHIFYVFIYVCLPFVFELSKHSYIDRRIGEFSYPIYLSHLLIISLISPILNKTGWLNYIGETSVILSTIVSIPMLKIISDPIESIRNSRYVRFKSSSSA